MEDVSRVWYVGLSAFLFVQRRLHFMRNHSIFFLVWQDIVTLSGMDSDY